MFDENKQNECQESGEIISNPPPQNQVFTQNEAIQSPTSELPQAPSEYFYVKDEAPVQNPCPPQQNYQNEDFYGNSGFEEYNQNYREPIYYTPTHEPNIPHKKVKRAKVPKPKKAKHGGFMKVACLCLVCALIGGAGGGLIASSLQAPQVIYNSGSPLSVVPSTGEEEQDMSAIVSGSLLTGAEVYNLGCQQAVGITTDVVYSNAFGMQTTAPVSGSGFIVTTDGYIVTNYHVIADAYRGGYDVTVVLYNGEQYAAEIIGGVEENDIAVLKIDATGLSPVTIGASADMNVGDKVFAIGNPLGELNFSMSSGSISALDREITVADQTTGQSATHNMFQIDAAVNEGNSGGPLYNSYGQVIGIVTAKYSDTGVEGLGFALPMDDISYMIEDLIENGKIVDKCSLGVTINTVDSTAAEYFNMVVGAYVYSINAGSCAAEAGIQVGDIITKFNGKDISSSDELIKEKRKYEEGQTVLVEFFRAGEHYETEITLDPALSEEEVQKMETPQTQTQQPNTGFNRFN